MRTVERNDACPCGSGLKYKKCCMPFLAGDAWPDTAEKLMRSRYTAFATGNVNHLWRTTHPENEERAGIAEEKFKRETLAYCKQVEFTSLKILEAWPEDEQGIAKVQFACEYKTNAGQTGGFTELSQFVRVDGQWVYLHGEQD